jgi:hypothetical protein
LYLHRLSSGDFGAAFEQFLGTGAGLSATSISRLTAQWQDGPTPSRNATYPASTTSIYGWTASI